jgi:hypothetical protein
MDGGWLSSCSALLGLFFWTKLPRVILGSSRQATYPAGRVDVNIGILILVIGSWLPIISLVMGLSMCI